MYASFGRLMYVTLGRTTKLQTFQKLNPTLYKLADY
jgi:hypothetical protein